MTAAIHSLRVSRIIPADADTLFRAWTDPQELMQSQQTRQWKSGVPRVDKALLFHDRRSRGQRPAGRRTQSVRLDAALERKGCRTVVMKGRQYRGYVYVDAEAVSSKSDLDYWIGLALDYNTAIASTNKGNR